MKRNTRGFTLAEVLMTVTITVLLLALAAPLGAGVYRDVKQRELDDTARQIYLAAQSQLVASRSSGTMVQLGTGQDITYTYEKGVVSTGADRLLPPGVVENHVLNNRILVRCNLETATVLEAFYSETDGLELTEQSRLDNPGKVGHYSGADRTLNPNQTEQLPTPQVVFLDEQSAQPQAGLTLRVTIPDAGQYSKHNLPLVVTLQELDSAGQPVADAWVQITVKEYPLGIFKLTLDSADLNNGVRFKGLNDAIRNFSNMDATFSSKPITPGANIRATAVLQGKTVDAVEYLTSAAGQADANSLFAGRTAAAGAEETVTVANPRHLQNLNRTFSQFGVSGTEAQPMAIHVQQSADIDWPGQPVFQSVNSGMEVKTNDTGAEDLPWLLSYDGKGLKIQNLKGTNGLFGTLAGEAVALKNVCLTAPEITGTDESFVGALVGDLIGTLDTGTVTLENCTVERAVVKGKATVGALAGRIVALNDVSISSCSALSPQVESSGSTGDSQDPLNGLVEEDHSAGGLVGYLYHTGAASIQNCTVKTAPETAELEVGGEPTMTGKGVVGGMIGQQRGADAVIMENCQVSAPKVSGAADPVGGLLGQLRASAAVTLTNCAAVDPLVEGTGAAGGLAGELDGTSGTVRLENCRTYLDTKKTTGGVTGGAAGVGGLVGSAQKVTFTNCFGSMAHVTATGDGGAGGFAGSLTNCTVSNSYGNTTQLSGTAGAALGGFAGVTSGGTADNCYAVSNQTGGTSRNGFWSGDGRVTNSYALTTLKGTDGKPTGAALAYGMASGADNSCRFWSAVTPAETESAVTKDYSEMKKEAGKPGGSWRTLTAAETKPYDGSLKNKNYPFWGLMGLDHYGNWPVQEDADGIKVFKKDGKTPLNVLLLPKGENQTATFFAECYKDGVKLNKQVQVHFRENETLIRSGNRGYYDAAKSRTCVNLSNQNNDKTGITYVDLTCEGAKMRVVVIVCDAKLTLRLTDDTTPQRLSVNSATLFAGQTKKKSLNLRVKRSDTDHESTKVQLDDPEHNDILTVYPEWSVLEAGVGTVTQGYDGPVSWDVTGGLDKTLTAEKWTGLVNGGPYVPEKGVLDQMPQNGPWPVLTDRLGESQVVVEWAMDPSLRVEAPVYRDGTRVDIERATLREGPIKDLLVESIGKGLFPSRVEVTVLKGTPVTYDLTAMVRGKTEGTFQWTVSKPGSDLLDAGFLTTAAGKETKSQVTTENKNGRTATAIKLWGEGLYEVKVRYQATGEYGYSWDTLMIQVNYVNALDDEELILQSRGGLSSWKDWLPVSEGETLPMRYRKNWDVITEGSTNTMELRGFMDKKKINGKWFVNLGDGIYHEVPKNGKHQIVPNADATGYLLEPYNKDDRDRVIAILSREWEGIFQKGNLQIAAGKQTEDFSFDVKFVTTVENKDPNKKVQLECNATVLIQEERGQYWLDIDLVKDSDNAPTINRLFQTSYSRDVEDFPCYYTKWENGESELVKDWRPAIYSNAAVMEQYRSIYFKVKIMKGTSPVQETIPEDILQTLRFSTTNPNVAELDMNHDVKLDPSTNIYYVRAWGVGGSWGGTPFRLTGSIDGTYANSDEAVICYERPKLEIEAEGKYQGKKVKSETNEVAHVQLNGEDTEFGITLTMKVELVNPLYFKRATVGYGPVGKILWSQGTTDPKYEGLITAVFPNGTETYVSNVVSGAESEIEVTVKGKVQDAAGGTLEIRSAYSVVYPEKMHECCDIVSIHFEVDPPKP